MDNKTIEIYEDCYCAKCEVQLTTENFHNKDNHSTEDYAYCDECWANVPKDGWL